MAQQTSRTLKYGTNYLLLTLIFAGILAVANFLSTRHFARVDLTEDKEYTVSPSTKKVLAGLDDIVTINAYFSKKIPPYLINLRQKVEDLLYEYSAYAEGNLEVEFIDPSEDPLMEQKLRFMGIPQVQLNIIEKDQAQLTNVYLGIAILYADKKEVIPVVDSTSNLEYDMTSAIVKVTSPALKGVGFIIGSDQESLDQQYTVVKAALQKNFTVTEIRLEDEKPIPDDVAALVVVGPKNVGERGTYKIDQFLMRGGKVAFLIDKVELRQGSLQATPVDPGLNGLLKRYGVEVKDNLILDRFHSNASFRTGFIAFQVPYPFWPKVIRQNFSQDHPVVSELESVTLPWTSSVAVVADKPEGLTFTELAKTSEFAWTRTGFYDLNPQQDYGVPPKTGVSYPLALLVSGKFPSFFADREAPPPQVEESEEGAGKEEITEGSKITESPETQIILVGNSRFIRDEFVSLFRGNQIFVLNTIDWLVLGDELIGIRSRGSTDRPLMELPERARTVVKFVNIFGVSILLAIWGNVSFYWRRRKKRILAGEIV
jgi:gliding-associated putative ABC transporter substrate-binding component GldG